MSYLLSLFSDFSLHSTLIHFFSRVFIFLNFYMVIIIDTVIQPILMHVHIISSHVNNNYLKYILISFILSKYVCFFPLCNYDLLACIRIKSNEIKIMIIMIIVMIVIIVIIIIFIYEIKLYFALIFGAIHKSLTL